MSLLRVNAKDRIILTEKTSFNFISLLNLAKNQLKGMSIASKSSCS
jgi:hypothetical protein